MGLCPTALPDDKSSIRLVRHARTNREKREIPINHFICRTFVKGIVKTERLVLQVSRQVNFLLGLVDHDHIFAGDGDHVQVLYAELYKEQKDIVTGTSSKRAEGQ